MSSTPARPIRFGALLRQADNRWSSIAEAARICDDLGFHAIHFIDHLLAIPNPEGDILESWTTMTACAAITRRVRVSANVLCNSFRSPALLAKMGATLDVISGSVRDTLEGGSAPFRTSPPTTGGEAGARNGTRSGAFACAIGTSGRPGDHQSVSIIRTREICSPRRDVDSDSPDVVSPRAEGFDKRCAVSLLSG